jgi:hypothetical protein
MEFSMGEIILLGIILIIVIAITRSNTKSGTAMISNYLRKKGSTPTLISRELLDVDRNTSTYLVEFINPNGDRISTRCKIRNSGIFIDNELYWLDPINLGVSTDTSPTRHKEKHIKRNPSLSELRRKKVRSNENSKNSISRTQYKADNKVKPKEKNKVKGIK